MTSDDAVVNLFALAHPGRLNVFRTIVRAGPDGIAAGKIASSVKIPANTASTHLSILTGAGDQSLRHGPARENQLQHRPPGH